VQGGQASVNKTDRVIEFKGGGWLGVYTADNADSILGEAFDLVVMDEAARVSPDVWPETIMPTLADRGGRAILISTPRGHNWFWDEWRRGHDSAFPEQASWQRPSSDNPNPRIQRAAEMARDRVPERVYLQEWMAEFIDDEGAVFRRLTEAATAEPQEAAVEDHDYIIGVDWGKHNDFTVLCVLDTTDGAVVAMDRFNRIDYALQRARLGALCERFPPVSIIAERNAMGEPIIEALLADDMPVRAFTTTNASKAAAIEGLALAFERGDIRIPPDSVLMGELQAYAAERLPSGMLRYSAPEGSHDDCVMALALAWYGGGKVLTGPMMA